MAPILDGMTQGMDYLFGGGVSSIKWEELSEQERKQVAAESFENFQTTCGGVMFALAAMTLVCVQLAQFRGESLEWFVFLGTCGGLFLLLGASPWSALRFSLIARNAKHYGVHRPGRLGFWITVAYLSSVAGSVILLIPPLQFHLLLLAHLVLAAIPVFILGRWIWLWKPPPGPRMIP